MSEMVDRVSLALRESLALQKMHESAGAGMLSGAIPPLDITALARAVIAAMREPTMGMMVAGSDEFFESANIGLSEYAAQEVFRRMIDAALSDEALEAIGCGSMK